MTTLFLSILALATITAALVSPMGERRHRELLANVLRPSDGELKPHCPRQVVGAARR